MNFDVQAVDLSGILNKKAEDKATQLPEPKTFHLLTVLPEVDEKFEGEGELIKSSQEIWSLPRQIPRKPRK